MGEKQNAFSVRLSSSLVHVVSEASVNPHQERAGIGEWLMRYSVGCQENVATGRRASVVT